MSRKKAKTPKSIDAVEDPWLRQIQVSKPNYKVDTPALPEDKKE